MIVHENIYGRRHPTLIESRDWSRDSFLFWRLCILFLVSSPAKNVTVNNQTENNWEIKKFRMLILLFFGIALGRIHELDLVKDDRAIIDLSSFAYNNNGTLSLTFKEFRLEEDEIKKMISDKVRDLHFIFRISITYRL